MPHLDEAFLDSVESLEALDKALQAKYDSQIKPKLKK